MLPRATAHEYMNVTAIPVIGGRLAPTWGKSGHSLMVNLFDRAAEWSARLGMPAFMPIASALFDAIAASAASLQSMDHLSLGIDGWPSAEIDARAALEEQLASGRDELASLTAPLTETILRLLTRLSEAGADAILPGEPAVPFFGPVFDRLLAKRVLVEQVPLSDWEVCYACKCGLPCRPIRKAGDAF